MASSINASTTAGVVTTADTSGVLNIQTAGVTAISIDASQAVSFTNSPTVTGGTANGVAYLNGSKVLTTGSALVFDGTNLGVGVTPSAWRSTFKALQLTGTATVSSNSNTTVYLGSNWYNNSSGADIYTVTGAAGIYAISAGVHAWYNAPSGTAGNAISFTQAMTLNNNGVLALQGASTTATGVGITFPATQSASSDANTLDDYEEGTFTPAFASTGLTVTYFTQRAIYTKVGRSVTASMYINVSGTSGTTTNLLKVTGLPFASDGTEYGFSAVFGVSQFSTYIPSAFMQNGVSEILVYRQNTITSMTGAELANGFYLFTITYFTA
jgi:hypothetical protein